MLFFNVNQFVYHADQSLELELRQADRWIRSESTTCAQFSTTSGIGSDQFAQLVEQLLLAQVARSPERNVQVALEEPPGGSARRLPRILSPNPIITHYPLALLCKLPVWLCDPNIINSINSCHQLPEYDIIKDGHTPYNITGAAQHETGRTERED